MRNLLTVAVLAIAFLFSTAAQAEMITFKLGAGNDDVDKFVGLLESLSLVAKDVGTGVEFTFQSSYDLGNPDHAGGAGKIFGNEFMVWNNHGVFSGGEGVKTGGSLNGATYPGTSQKLGTADFTAVTDGYTYSQMEDMWITSFILDYKDNNLSWDSFLEILMEPVGLMSQEEAFTIGVHLQALEDGNSAKVVTFTVDNGSNATPEPATMLIFGLGAIGLGGVAVRRRHRQTH